MDRRKVLLALISLVLWPLVGLAVIAWGLHTTDPVHGSAAVDAGRLLGTAGVVGTLLWLYASHR